MSLILETVNLYSGDMTDIAAAEYTLGLKGTYRLTRIGGRSTTSRILALMASTSNLIIVMWSDWCYPSSSMHFVLLESMASRFRLRSWHRKRGQLEGH